jgi:phytoene dehydrogenase-like protein
MYIAFLMAASADIQKSGLHGYPVGGMGSFTQILARSVQESGAHLRTETDVERILVNDGKVHGVLLKNGQTLSAKTIVSNLDARRTFLELVGRDHLDNNFAQKVTKLHARAGYMRLHCAVERLPKWRVLPSFDGPGHIMPNLELLEKAWDEASYGKIPKEPLLGFRAPCILDKSLAPAGKYALEGWVQYAPVRPNKGSWDDIREEVAEQIIDYADEWLIDFRKSIISWKLYTPLDIERWSNVTDGHMCHMDMTTDQMFFLRPLLGWTNYRTPIEGLYLCGSATHGGGAVTGIPGHNSAHVLLEDWKTL